jgi:hypothetical protein
VKSIKIFKVLFYFIVTFVFFMLIIQKLITGVPKTIVNHINVLEKSDETFILKTRKRYASADNSDLSTITEELQFFNAAEVALVLIHPDVNDSSMDSHTVRVRNNIEGPLKQLVELAREKTFGFIILQQQPQMVFIHRCCSTIIAEYQIFHLIK